MMKFAWTGVLPNIDGARSFAISALSGWLPKDCASATSMLSWQWGIEGVMEAPSRVCPVQ